MIKAVLLDLDDTLLHNPTSVFLQAYLELANKHFQSIWSIDSISDTLRNAVRMMMFGDRNIYQTNLNVLLESLEGLINVERKIIYDAFQSFYANEYLDVRNCTSPVEIAPRLIDTLKKRGYAIVIATNPIYPEEAIRMRLNWANLPDDLSTYAFVTTADNMHFAKPNPSYYAEILGRVGIEPDEAIMVGNDFNNDIKPAKTVGLHTRHLDANSLHLFMNEIDALDTLQPVELSPEMMIPQLSGNVGALFGLIDNMKSNYWNQHPDPDEWSPIQIICHLLEKENESQRPNIEHILEEENYFVVERMPLGPEAPPCNTDGYKVALDFLKSRNSTIKLVEQISSEQWQRKARHSIFGPTNLLEIVHFTAQHDRLHLNQLCQTIGNCE